MTDANQEKKWFIAFMDHHEGPFTPQEIRQRIEQRTVEANPFIWCEGIPNWIRLQDSGLKLQPTPPPLPSLSARAGKAAFAPMPARRTPAARTDFASPEEYSSTTAYSTPEDSGYSQSEMSSAGYPEAEPSPHSDYGSPSDYASLSDFEASPRENIGNAIEAPREDTNPALRALREKQKPGRAPAPVESTRRSRNGKDLSGLIEINSGEQEEPAPDEGSDENHDHRQSELETAVRNQRAKEAELLAEKSRNQARMRIWLFCILVLALACIGLIFFRFGP